MVRSVVALAVWSVVAFGTGVSGAAKQPGAGPPAYRIHSETLLILDRWRGTRTVVVERTDIRQRLRLDAWALAPAVPGRLDLRVDLELGSDLGPTTTVLDAVPDARRTVFDLYDAHLDLRGALGVVDARLGRHRVVDALGLDALDGASVDLSLIPHVTVRAMGGLAVRRAWSVFGPDIYAPDGTALRDGPGAVYGVGLRTRDLDRVHVDVAWRQLSDAEAIVRDELGAAVLARPLADIDLSAGAVIDLMWTVPRELRAGVGWRATPALRLDADWRHTRPTFAADSIWFAFGPEPVDALRLAGQWTPGLWTIVADAELRMFDPGPVSGEDPGGDLALVGGVRAERAIMVGVHRARVGVDGRTGLGYGGGLHHLDVSARVPVRLILPEDPLWVRLRLGGAFFDVPDRDLWDGWAGWLAGSAEWYAAPGIRLDGVLEGHAHRAEALRIRALARLTLEDDW